MKRREFITLLSGAVAAPVVWPLAARAQQPNQMRRIGVVMGMGDTAEARSRLMALRQALKNLGWTDDQNVRIDVRGNSSDPQIIQQETAELLATKPDVIVSGASIAVAQVVRTSPTVPIVFAGITDPVGQGFVASMARPGGNATGFAAYEVSLGGKWIETLKELSPSLRRAAIIYEPSTAPYMAGMARSVATAGSTFGVEINDVPVRDIGELENTISSFGRQPGSGLILPPAAFTVTHSALIVALAAKYRLPAIYAFRTIVTAGGLISYGIDSADQYARAAGYVDRIFRGVKPSDLPVQGPIKFELAINQKTAKVLGLAVPPTLLARADEVIE
jgi:putative ABC transport system substrate-binding protein